MSCQPVDQNNQGVRLTMQDKRRHAKPTVSGRNTLSVGVVLPQNRLSVVVVVVALSVTTVTP